MGRNPSSEAISCSATYKFPNILMNPIVHYRVRNSRPLVSILSQINLVNTTLYYLSKIHFNIIPPSTYTLPICMIH
jgi:hypothetical protein